MSVRDSDCSRTTTGLWPWSYGVRIVLPRALDRGRTTQFAIWICSEPIEHGGESREVLPCLPSRVSGSADCDIPEMRDGVVSPVNPAGL